MDKLLFKQTTDAIANTKILCNFLSLPYLLKKDSVVRQCRAEREKYWFAQVGAFYSVCCTVKNHSFFPRCYSVQFRIILLYCQEFNLTRKQKKTSKETAIQSLLTPATRIRKIYLISYECRKSGFEYAYICDLGS